MAHLQTLMLEPPVSMVSIVEETQKGSLTPTEAAEAAKAASSLLGNASAHFSKERRKNSKKEQPLAEDKDISEYYRRRTVSDNEGSLRLEIGSKGIPLNQGEVVPTRGGYVCVQAHHSAGEVIQLETRPRGGSPGCVQPGLDQPPGEGICQPSLEHSCVTLVLIANCGAGISCGLPYLRGGS